MISPASSAGRAVDCLSNGQGFESLVGRKFLGGFFKLLFKIVHFEFRFDSNYFKKLFSMMKSDDTTFHRLRYHFRINKKIVFHLGKTTKN